MTQSEHITKLREALEKIGNPGVNRVSTFIWACNECGVTATTVNGVAARNHQPDCRVTIVRAALTLESASEPSPAVWRVGTKVPLNVYEGDHPVCQCHTPEDATRIVAALNQPSPNVLSAADALAEYSESVFHHDLGCACNGPEQVCFAHSLFSLAHDYRTVRGTKEKRG